MLEFSTKTDYDSNNTEIERKLTDHDHDKYITTPEFNNLAGRVFTARLAQANLVRKTDIDDKWHSLNQKINSNKKNIYLLKINFKKFKFNLF